MYIVYLIEQNYTQEIYIGVTSNLKARLFQHNRHQNTSTNRKSGKWILIYAEAYRSKNDALNREKRLKHHGSAKHELLKRIAESRLKS